MKTSIEPSVPAPSSAATAAAPAASATGPRKKSPGREDLADRQHDREDHPEEPTHELSLVAERDGQPASARRA